MSIFDDDPFGSIFDEFLGRRRPGPNRRREEFIRSEEEDRAIDFVEDDKKIYLIFELPGFDEKDVMVVVKGGKIEISAQKSRADGVQPYLMQRFKQGIHFSRTLPKIVNHKKFSQSVKNGILEVVFEKK